jgi:hypothetical protein
VELERDLDELTDVRLVVDDEHLGDSVTVCHGPHDSLCRIVPHGSPQHASLVSSTMAERIEIQKVPGSQLPGQ